MRFIHLDWYCARHRIAVRPANGDGVGPSLGMALRTAFFALIGFEMARLSTAATLLTIWRTVHGEVWALMLIAPAVAAIILTVLSLREVAAGFGSRRPPSGRP